MPAIYRVGIRNVTKGESLGQRAGPGFTLRNENKLSKFFTDKRREQFGVCVFI
jgi:hypothetical protein